MGCYVDITKNEFTTSACVGRSEEYIIKWKKARYVEQDLSFWFRSHNLTQKQIAQHYQRLVWPEICGEKSQTWQQYIGEDCTY